jgi:glycine/D-amino acid oxidase-like deaminating enzyme
MSRGTLSIVGAGITGLMIAYRATNSSLDRDITVFDEGPDPRSTHAPRRPGATYGGLDARHISLTETTPWATPDRQELITIPSSEYGWNCLAGQDIDHAEKEWLAEFLAATDNPEQQNKDYNEVLLATGAGAAQFSQLETELPAVFTPSSAYNTLPVLFTDPAALEKAYRSEHEVDHNVTVYSSSESPPDVEHMFAKNEELFAGGLLIAGTSYRVKTMSCDLIAWLENKGVHFVWNTTVGADSLGGLSVPKGDVVFAGGVGESGFSTLLDRAGINMQGVAGCWITLDNPGVSRPLKILAREPINYINVTPRRGKLLISGGYGWVGRRNYTEACFLATPLAAIFVSEVSRFFPTLDSIVDVNDVSICVRPALPSGVPLVGQIDSPPAHRIFVCVAGAAGGFTQSPEVSRRIVRLLAS